MNAPKRNVSSNPPESDAGEFLSTMPPHYRGYDPSIVKMHANIVAARATMPIHADVWRRFPDGGVAICVVADDRSGLLSLIAAGLTAHDLDVVAAQIYTRQRPDGAAEAIDLFWLRRSPLSPHGSTISEADVLSVRLLLSELVRGSLPPPLPERPAEMYSEAPGMTWVRFEEDYGNAAVLVVQTHDRPGLLLTISRSLFCLDLQVVRSEVSTTQGRALDKFYVVDFDGQPIRASRRRAIESEVLEAVQSLGRAGEEG
jgi:[protein-PII] uridylyltransferase